MELHEVEKFLQSPRQAYASKINYDLPELKTFVMDYSEGNHQPLVEIAKILEEKLPQGKNYIQIFKTGIHDKYDVQIISWNLSLPVIISKVHIIGPCYKKLLNFDTDIRLAFFSHNNELIKDAITYEETGRIYVNAIFNFATKSNYMPN